MGLRFEKKIGKITLQPRSEDAISHIKCCFVKPESSKYVSDTILLINDTLNILRTESLKELSHFLKGISRQSEIPD